MTRDAKLYYLFSEDLMPIKKAIEMFSVKYNLTDKIAIYQRNSQVKVYTILSIDNKVDEIVENNGGKLAEKEDLLPKAIKKKIDFLGTQIFGDEDLIIFLSAQGEFFD